MKDEEIIRRLVRAKFNVTRGNTVIVQQELASVIQAFEDELPGTFEAMLSEELDRMRQEGAAYDYPKAQTQ